MIIYVASITLLPPPLFDRLVMDLMEWVPAIRSYQFEQRPMIQAVEFNGRNDSWFGRGGATIASLTSSSAESTSGKRNGASRNTCVLS